MGALLSFGSGAASTYAIALISAIIHLIAFLILILRGASHPSIRKRGVPLLLISILVSFALFSFLLLRDAFQFAAACSVDFWLSTVAMPAWVLLVLLRGTHVYLQQRSNQKRMDQLRTAISRQQRDSALFKRSSRMSLGLDLLTDEAEKQGIAWHEILQQSTSNSETYVPRNRLAWLDIAWLMPAVFVVLLAAHIGGAYYIQRTSKNLAGTGDYARCLVASKWEYLPAHGAALLYGLLATPTLVFILHRIKNAYQIQVEIVVAYASTLFMLITELFISHILQPADLFAYVKLWPSGTLSAIFLIPAMAAFSIYPAWVALRGVPQHRRGLSGDFKPPKVPRADPAMIQLLEVFLSDGRNLRAFKEFSVRDYSVDSVLFYSRIQKLKRQVASEAGLDVYAYEQAIYDLYESFIRQGAKFELNLDPSIRAEVFKRLESGDLGLDIYDAAYEETLQIVWRNVWPRFAAEQREKQTLRRSHESSLYLTRQSIGEVGADDPGYVV